MRRPITCLVGLGLTWALATSVNAADQVKWQPDLEAAYRTAREQNRPILLHFWSPDCGHCMQVEESVFARGSVASTLGDFFVPVKINAQKEPRLAARYRIQSVPKDVILSPTGQEVHRLVTPASPQQYIAQLSAVAFRAGMSPERENPPSWAGPPSSPVAQDRLSNRDPSRPPELPPMSAGSRFESGPDRDGAWRDPARSTEPTRSEAAPSSQPQEVINRYARGNSQMNSQPAGRGEVYDQVAPTQSPQQTPQRQWPRWPNQGTPDPAAAPAQTAATAQPTVGPPRPRSDTDRRTAPTTVGQDRRPPLGMDGYCPVTLLKKDVWKQGNPRFGIVHRGRLYLFTGEDERKVFAGNPDDYSPVLAGIDPVHLNDSGEAVGGRRAHGVVYRKRVYLFASEENLQRFWQEPERFAAPIRQAMETGNVGGLFR